MKKNDAVCNDFHADAQKLGIRLAAVQHNVRFMGHKASIPLDDTRPRIPH